MSKEQNFTNLIKKHFRFLVNEYKFSFDEFKNTFTNKKVDIAVSKFERISIRIELWLLTEPDFTRLDIRWLVEEQVDYSVTDKYLLEENIKHYSSLLHRNAYLFTDEAVLKPIILLGLKKMFVNIAIGRIPAEQLTTTSYLNNLPSMDKKYYDYIKERDPKWDPTEELEKYFKR